MSERKRELTGKNYFSRYNEAQTRKNIRTLLDKGILERTVLSKLMAQERKNKTSNSLAPQARV